MICRYGLSSYSNTTQTASTEFWDSKDLIYDQVALFLAAITIALSFRIFFLKLPRSWTLGTAKLSETCLSWFMSRLSLRPYPAGPTFDALNQLIIKEWRSGVSFKKSKIELLEEWACSQFQEEDERIKLIEEWLPLLEIFGFGTSAALVLLVPMLKYLQ